MPTYTLGTTFLGGVPRFSKAFIPAYNSVSGNVHFGPFTAFRSDSLFGASELYPTAQLFWIGGGVNNFMTYLTGDFQVIPYSRR